MARTLDPTRMTARVRATLETLVGISSVSGQEEAIRDHLRGRLTQAGLTCHVDSAGNLIARLPGDGPPLLLNAHMDRVPPGRGHRPIVRRGRLYSDGATNLGADDAAGLAIILLALEALLVRDAPRPSLVVLFTVGEEVGLRGASAFDPAPWNVSEGIVFDNAGEPGAVVTRGSSYIAFDAVLRGASGHPGKDLSGTASAIDMFRRVATPIGIMDGDSTRISLGTLSGGVARNAIPAEVRVSGEVRSLLSGEPLQRLLASIERDFTLAAQEVGGSADITFAPHGAGYSVDTQEPLVRAWRAAWEARGHTFETLTTFIGSDANALRQRGLRVFTVSTGVRDEHTLAESIALAPLAELVHATVSLLTAYHAP